MRKIVIFLCLLMSSLFISDTVFAGWTQPKGHAYNQLTFSHYVTREKFTTVKYDGAGFSNSGTIHSTGGGIEKVQTAKFTSTGFTYYGEYGIIDSLTVVTAIPFWKWAYSGDTVKYSGDRGPSGVGDIDFGLRYNLFPSLLGNVVSIQGAVKIPEAYDYGYPLTHLSMGDGQYDATFLLQAGRGLGKGYAWLNAGYKFRFENDKYGPITFKPSDQIKVSFGGGYAITSKFSIRGLIDWTKSVGNASVSQELIIDNYKYGGLERSQDNVLIRDTLGLEPDALSAGIDLVYNLTKECWPKCIQTVLSYSRDLEGIKPFESKNWALGETFGLALVYMF